MNKILNIAIFGILVFSFLAIFEMNLLQNNGIFAVKENNSISLNSVNTNKSSYEKTIKSLPLWWPNIQQNVQTGFNPHVMFPNISNSSFISPFSVIIGNCIIGKFVLAAPTSVCRGDEGSPIFVGDLSNIQDGTILHGLITINDGKNLDNRKYSVDGKLLLGNDTGFSKGYSVYVGYNTSLAHDSMVHGPAWVGNNTFIGMKSIIFNAKVGNNVAVGISSTITDGVHIPDNKFVPPGSVITKQSQADSLPSRIGSSYEKINGYVVTVNAELAKEYKKLGMEKFAQQREDQMEKSMLLQ
ncbi:MAG TPA: hypothetical protein VN704_06090 [Verrucomicrobiae bacterium]|nr:hypothetical protein [Verrucomicrobiae bacterium]